MSSKVLVTGGTGLIGSFLVEKLVKNNDVKCLILKNSETKFLDDLGVKIAYGDITDISSLNHAIKDVDVVFHLAAAFKKDLPKNPTDDVYYNVNVKGTKNVLELCKQNEVERVIHFSASGVYGHSSNTPINENSPYRPSNPYEKSKCEGEKIALKYNELGLPITIIQPTIVYGPRETVAFLRLFKAIKNGTFRIIGSGENKLHLVYVKNLVDGIILASKKKIAIGQRYLIGDERAYAVSEIVETIASELGVKIPKMKIPYLFAKVGAVPFEIAGKIMRTRPPISRYTVDFLAKNRVYDISKARKELGYKSKISLKEGIERTVKWYEENDLL
jgi:nucleoside-diphosphate-sugar epimerase